MQHITTRFHFMMAATGLCLLLVAGLSSSVAQGQCDIATSINYPVDLNQFRLAQDFGVASPRHQGRFHTGEDWFIGPRASLGQPVSAIASGLVTFSSPRGWGRDGGVVIIQHTFPDGTILYSQFGHMMETETVIFPQRLDCVQAGQTIGTVGDVRPAPHLHFEIRVNRPDVPGPGYTREDPVEGGWRRPAQIVTNMQARLNRSFRWQISTGITAPPLLLDDYTILAGDGATIRRITPDGQFLSLAVMEKAIISITDGEAGPLVTHTDGTVARIDTDGQPLETWQLDFAPDSPPLIMDGARIFHTANNTLVALTPDQRAILWRLDGVPAYDDAINSGSLLALIAEGRLWLVSREGTLLDSREIKTNTRFAPYPDGTLAAYTSGALWRIDVQGDWLRLADVPALEANQTSALLALSDGSIYLTDGSQLLAYSPAAAPLWQADLPNKLTGQVEMATYGDLILMTSSGGQILVARKSGGFCGITRIYAVPDAGLWHNLGDDGILRVAVGDQIIGLNWQEFNQGC